tara:strand:+ start:928 stop:1281 length:354 start_codon:yes stop_codon:yes gene_type:complete
MVLEVHKMKVSNRPSFTVLAALVSAAVLIGSSVGVAHAEDGAERLIKLRSKAAEIRASLYEVPTNTYLAEDGSERFKEMLRGRTQSEFSATHIARDYLAEDGSERLRKLSQSAERKA